MESASKPKHPRRSGNEHTIPAPVVPILWDRIISHTSQQQRFQIYGPLKLAIKNQRSCSFSRLKRLLRTPPTRGLTRAPTGALTGRIDWLWSGRNRHQARGGQTPSGLEQEPSGRRPATFFSPSLLRTDWSSAQTAFTRFKHNCVFVERSSFLAGKAYS